MTLADPDTAVRAGRALEDPNKPVCMSKTEQ